MSNLAEVFGISAVIALILLIIFLILFIVGVYTQNDSPKKFGKIGMVITGFLLVAATVTMLLI